MEEGVAADYKKVLATDRKQAIKTVSIIINDIILLRLRERHETYQEINGVRQDFDDMKIVKEILEQLYK
jgi:UDP-N-acetylmuramoyl-L-alanyl-D-glutamate--2,6-diaminopimelate ligase